MDNMESNKDESTWEIPSLNLDPQAVWVLALAAAWAWVMRAQVIPPQLILSPWEEDSAIHGLDSAVRTLVWETICLPPRVLEATCRSLWTGVTQVMPWIQEAISVVMPLIGTGGRALMALVGACAGGVSDLWQALPPGAVGDTMSAIAPLALVIVLAWLLASMWRREAEIPQPSGEESSSSPSPQ